MKFATSPSQIKKRLANGEDALLLSIEKWLAVMVSEGKQEDAENCALCQTYYGNEEEGHCVGCPVREKTGKIYCVGTAYITFLNHEEKTGCNDDNTESCPKCIEIAAQEVKFLIGLYVEQGANNAR